MPTTYSIAKNKMKFECKRCFLLRRRAGELYDEQTTHEKKLQKNYTVDDFNIFETIISLTKCERVRGVSRESYAQKHLSDFLRIAIVCAMRYDAREYNCIIKSP